VRNAPYTPCPHTLQPDMFFLTPIWLLGLLPWAAMVVLLLWGKRRQVDVPFVELWQRGGEAVQRDRRRIPPVFIIASLLAVFFCILAAAQPAWNTLGGRATIIVDRGITMSASADRIAQTVDRARQLGKWDSIELISVPNTPSVHSASQPWEGIARALPLTAVDTRRMLAEVIQVWLSRGDEPIVVLSDQRLETEDPRVIRISPSTALMNAGIVHIAARGTSSTRVMVNLRNQSDEHHAKLFVNEIEHEIDLPQTGGERAYFFDLNEPAEVIHVRMEVHDDLAADNEAWLVRGGSRRAIEVRSPVPAELSRMIDVYEGSQAHAGHDRIIVAESEKSLGDEPGVILLGGATSSPGDVSSVTHPIVEHVSAFATSSNIPRRSNGVAWEDIVVANGQAIVSVREKPARQVRVAFDWPEFARSPDFVIFWTNVLNWVGGGAGEEWEARPVQQLSADWASVDSSPGELWPGLYRRGDGELLAMNATDVDVSPLLADAAQETPSEMKTSGRSAQLLGRLLLSGVFAGVAIAVLAWPRTYSAKSPARV